MNWIVNQEAELRLSMFLLMLFSMLLWEAFAPRRYAPSQLWQRRAHNLCLVAINTAVLRFALPFAAVAAANIAWIHGWGLFNQFLAPVWLEFVVTLLLLDLLIYGQHVMFHKLPWLWRMHRMHHTDEHTDVTTAVRFHPLEIILSMLIKIIAVIVLGAPVLAVVVFEVVLNASAMFNHANIKLPLTLDRYLRWVIVTPDMHRIHHSVNTNETDSNFGFNLPWWDRIFHTYRAQPAAGHEQMQVGLTEFKDKNTVSAGALLLQPFKKP